METKWSFGGVQVGQPSLPSSSRADSAACLAELDEHGGPGGSVGTV